MGAVRLELPPEAAAFGASGFPQLVKIHGSAYPVFGLAYDGTSSEAAHWRWTASDYGGGDVTVTVLWYADTASTGGVVWEAALAAITPNVDTQDVETDGYATAATAADTHLGTTGQRLHAVDVTLTGASLDSLAAGDWCSLRLARLPANAADTMSGDAIVVGVIVTYDDGT